MPYNGSGTFTLPAGNPVVTGTTISSTINNNTNSDLANGLSNAVTRNGQSPATANLPMGNFKLTGLAAGTVAGDSARYDELILKAPINSPTFTGTATIPGYITVGDGSAGIQLQTQTAFTTSGTSTAYTLAPSSPLATFTASIDSAGNMTVTAVTMGTIYVGMRITGSGIPAGSYVISGASLAWVTNVAVTIASTTITGTAGLIVNERYRVKFNADSGASPTLAVNGLTAKAIKQYNSVGVKIEATVYINQLADVEYDGTDYVILDAIQRLNQIQPITASAASSALTVTLNPTTLDFRNASLTSGTVNTVSIASAISVIVPSTVTLATYSAQQSRIALIALYNGGTPVLGVTSMAGGENLDETTLMTTTAIGTSCTFTGAIAVTTGILTLSATGTGTLALGMALTGTGIPPATGPSTIYVKALLTGTLGAAASTYSTNTTVAVASTTLTGRAGAGVYTTAAVTASPFRVVGYIESTQATAGTWATAPSTIQGQGGQALAAMSSLGYGQTWQTVTRVSGTTYYNTTGKPIIVTMQSAAASPTNQINIVSINGSTLAGFDQSYSVAAGTFVVSSSVLVPPNASYSMTFSSSVASASELR